jgi:hypothetical protein
MPAGKKPFYLPQPPGPQGTGTGFSSDNALISRFNCAQLI